MAQRYRKLPVDIEAIQWTGDNEAEIASFVGPAGDGGADYDRAPHPNHPGFFVIIEGPMAGGRLWVAANHTWLSIEVGEWVARDAAGFYPIKDAIFTASYEPVDLLGQNRTESP